LFNNRLTCHRECELYANTAFSQQSPRILLEKKWTQMQSVLLPHDAVNGQVFKLKCSSYLQSSLKKLKVQSQLSVVEKTISWALGSVYVMGTFGLVQKYPQYNPEEKGRFDKMIVFDVLIIFITLVCDFVTPWRESGKPTFLVGVFGPTHFQTCVRIYRSSPLRHFRVS
jgi:hypothetical protein